MGNSKLKAEKGVINIICDGFYCKACNDFHPTLKWHEKYDEYLLDRKEQWEMNKKKRPNLFKNAIYVDSLNVHELEEERIQEKCFICGNKTHFKNILTGHYVCSNECKYKDNDKHC